MLADCKTDVLPAELFFQLHIYISQKGSLNFFLYPPQILSCQSVALSADKCLGTFSEHKPLGHWWLRPEMGERELNNCRGDSSSVLAFADLRCTPLVLNTGCGQCAVGVR